MNHKAAWNKRITTSDEQRIIDLYTQGLSGRQIVDSLNGKFKTHKTIYDTLRRYGVSRRVGPGHNPVRHRYFEEINTPAKAYILGLMITDGWVQPGRRQVGIQLQQGDRSVIESIRAEWETPNKIVLCKKKPFRGRDGNTYHSSPMCRIMVSSAPMIGDLAQYGVIARKSDKTYLPILNDRTLMPHLLRGVFDGDGCIYPLGPSRRCALSLVGTPELVAQVGLYLRLELEITQTRPTQRRPSIDSKQPLANISITRLNEVPIVLKYLYENSTDSTRIRRKYERIKDLIL